MTEAKRRAPFGMIAVQKGFVSTGQVKRALEIQRAESDRGKQHRLIGRILSDNGWISDAQIYQVMGSLHKTGIQMPTQGVCRGL